MRIKGGYYIVKYIYLATVDIKYKQSTQPYLLDTRLHTHAVLN